MRILPRYILNKLRSYNRDLNLVWNDRGHFWVFTYKGCEQFVWRHADGSTGFNADGHSDEILETIMRADMRTRNRNAVKVLDEAEAKASYEDQRADEKFQEHMTRESRPAMEFAQRGASKPFSYITNNPLAKEA